MDAMRTMAAAVLASLLAAIGVAPAFGQSAAERTIEQFTCKDVMREAGQNRDVAIAFLHGYLLGKSGTSKFNVETLAKQTDAFIDQCLENPKAKAEDVMAKIKG
jgi:HdeA/HdeB family